MRHQQFASKEIRGFGLLQRERDFANYQDLFNLYQHVPSVWVEAEGHWGEGEVHLVELSTDFEGLDNVVAFWDPKTKPQPLTPYSFSYKLHWTKDTDYLSPNKVVATRVGTDPRDPQARQFVIDFGGPKLSTLPENSKPEVIASCSPNAGIADRQVFWNPFDHTWRVTLKLEPKAGNQDPVDLRCTLQKGEEVLSETWTYLWSPL
jgi:glucans biosynthesis protein